MDPGFRRDDGWGDAAHHKQKGRSVAAPASFESIR